MLTELFNHVWQSMLFAIAAGVLTHVFRNNRAQIRYWLWYSASSVTNCCQVASSQGKSRPR